MTPGFSGSSVPLSGKGPFVVGADGGGTGSRAMVMDSEGRELARASGPPALINPADPGAAANAIGITVLDAIRSAGLSPPARTLWVGLAGAGLPGGREVVEISLRSMELASAVRVGMDVEGAHWDAFGPTPGVVLAVGTGSITWGRDREGGEIRVGGWGTPLSEEGSGYWLGMEGLRAVVRAADGRDPPTRLTQDLLGVLGLSDHRELVSFVADASKGEVAALAPLVLEAAAGGDPAARTIVDEGLTALGRYLEAVGKQWRPAGTPFPLALAGGLLEKDGLFRDPLLSLAIRKGAEIRPDPVLPVRGAARLALEMARIS